MNQPYNYYFTIWTWILDIVNYHFFTDSCSSEGTNPLLSKLCMLLHDEYQKNEPRCMIFVKTRFIAQTLCDCLKELEELSPFNINPEYFTGANAAGFAGGECLQGIIFMHLEGLKNIGRVITKLRDSCWLCGLNHRIYIVGLNHTTTTDVYYGLRTIPSFIVSD